MKYCCTVRAPVFGRHQFFGTSEHCGKAHGSLLSWWMTYNYTACCWKWLIALFKVPNTGAFTVQMIFRGLNIFDIFDLFTLQEDCEANLAVAMPALDAAVRALDTLKQQDITIVKTMTNPPAGVRLVMEAICIMKVRWWWWWWWYWW